MPSLPQSLLKHNGQFFNSEKLPGWGPSPRPRSSWGKVRDCEGEPATVPELTALQINNPASPTAVLWKYPARSERLLGHPEKIPRSLLPTSRLETANRLGGFQKDMIASLGTFAYCYFRHKRSAGRELAFSPGWQHAQRCPLAAPTQHQT